MLQVTSGCTACITRRDFLVGSIFDCPNHGSRFSSAGAVQNGPANSSLFSRTVVFDATAQTLLVS